MAESLARSVSRHNLEDENGTNQEAIGRCYSQHQTSSYRRSVGVFSNKELEGDEYYWVLSESAAQSSTRGSSPIKLLDGVLNTDQNT
jgi:hypothetical protein